MMYTLPNKSEFDSMMDKLLNEINNSNTPEGGFFFFFFDEEKPTEEPAEDAVQPEPQLPEAEIEIAQLKQQLADAKAEIADQKTTIKQKDEDISELKRVHQIAETRQEEAEEQAQEYLEKYNELLQSIPQIENSADLQAENESLKKELKEAKAAIKPGLISVQDLMIDARSLDRASRLNLITSLERLLAQQSGDINKILESERNSLNVEIKDEDYSQDEDGRSVFVVIKTLDKIFKKLGIVQKADNLKLARLYAYISGYKYTTIKNRLPVDDDIPERSKDEVKTVQKLLNDVNSGISMN